MLDVEILDNLSVCISFELRALCDFGDTCTVVNSIQNSYFFVCVVVLDLCFLFLSFLLLEDKQMFEFGGI